MQKVTHIRRNLMLKEMSIRWLPNGKRNIFSIKFVDKEGKLRFFPQVFATGLSYSVKDSRQRGVQPCDCKGNPDPNTHIYPVGIDRIVKFNNMEVIL
ncbi:MAG: hypothetical protein LBN95_08015 [Prevotellaceae bacterium]|jgi:hypothetical protein|nr:hypothetical protein [Prevotellaceae bacterium]